MNDVIYFCSDKTDDFSNSWLFSVLTHPSKYAAQSKYYECFPQVRTNIRIDIWCFNMFENHFNMDDHFRIIFQHICGIINCRDSWMFSSLFRTRLIWVSRCKMIYVRHHEIVTSNKDEKFEYLNRFPDSQYEYIL